MPANESRTTQKNTQLHRLTENGLVFPGLPLLTGVIAVSFSAIFIKLCLVPAAAIGMYRLLMTVILLTPFVWMQKGQRQPLLKVSIRDGLAILASGFLLGLHFLFWIGSLKATSVASSMLITTLQPVFVGIVAFMAFGERMNRRRVISLVLAFLGTIVIAFGDHSGQSSTLKGDMLSFLGTLAIGGYMLVGQRIRARLPSTAYNWSVFLVAGITLFTQAAVTGARLSGYRSIDWVWLVLLALIPTLFGHALFNWLLRYVSATTISVTILGEPIGATILAFWLLHEPVYLYQILGGAIIFIGVSAYMRKQSASTRVKADDSKA